MWWQCCRVARASWLSFEMEFTVSLVSPPICHRMSIAIFNTLAVATTIVACIRPSAARSQSILRQTIEGCGIHDASAPNGTDDAVSWSGDCVDGLAHELGIVRKKWKGADSNGTSEVKSMFHRGKRFGFMHIKTLLEDGEKEHWAYTAPVGELLSMADEYMSKGDRASARVALRKLMGRFPDHKLAGIAATMLSELQGKSP